MSRCLSAYLIWQKSFSFHWRPLFFRETITAPATTDPALQTLIRIITPTRMRPKKTYFCYSFPSIRVEILPWLHADENPHAFCSVFFSFRDGSYYYSNPSGSTYYNDGKGSASYSAPKGSGKWVRYNGLWKYGGGNGRQGWMNIVV